VIACSIHLIKAFAEDLAFIKKMERLRINTNYGENISTRTMMKLIETGIFAVSKRNKSGRLSKITINAFGERKIINHPNSNQFIQQNQNHQSTTPSHSIHSKKINITSQYEQLRPIDRKNQHYQSIFAMRMTITNN
jgi:hypothetical protein